MAEVFSATENHHGKTMLECSCGRRCQPFLKDLLHSAWKTGALVSRVSRKTNIYISIKVDSVLPFSHLGRALLCRSAQAFVPLKFKYALGRRSTPAIVPLFICILIWRSKEDCDECGELIQSSHSHKPFGRCNVTSWPQGEAWWRCCSINAQLQMSLPGF